MSQFCTKCGTSLPEDAKFCPKCGNKIEKTSPMEDAYKGFEKKLEFQELEGDLERIAELKKGLERIEKKYGTDVCNMPATVVEKYRKMRTKIYLIRVTFSLFFFSYVFFFVLLP